MNFSVICALSRPYPIDTRTVANIAVCGFGNTSGSKKEEAFCFGGHLASNNTSEDCSGYQILSKHFRRVPSTYKQFYKPGLTNIVTLVG